MKRGNRVGKWCRFAMQTEVDRGGRTVAVVGWPIELSIMRITEPSCSRAILVNNEETYGD